MGLNCSWAVPSPSPKLTASSTAPTSVAQRNGSGDEAVVATTAATAPAARDIEQQEWWRLGLLRRPPAAPAAPIILDDQCPSTHLTAAVAHVLKLESQANIAAVAAVEISPRDGEPVRQTPSNSGKAPCLSPRQSDASDPLHLTAAAGASIAVSGQGSRTSRSWACEACARVKAACYSGDGSTCSRCMRLRVECRWPQNGVRAMVTASCQSCKKVRAWSGTKDCHSKTE